jgi:hypothetical protein
MHNEEGGASLENYMMEQTGRLIQMILDPPPMRCDSGEQAGDQDRARPRLRALQRCPNQLNPLSISAPTIQSP